MSLKIVLSLILTVIGLIIFWFKKRFSYWNERGFQFIEPEFFFGNLRGVGYKVHLHQKLTKYYNEFRDKAVAVGMFFFVQPVLLITNLDLVKNVLVKDFNQFHDRGIYYNTEIDPLSAHLFAIEGVEWKNMRAKLSPTFTSGKMKMMFGTVANICLQMVKHLQQFDKPTEIEMKDVLARFTTDVIGNVAFGLDVNSMENPDSMFRRMGRKVFESTALRTMKVMFLFVFRDLGRKLRMAITQKEVSEFFIKSFNDTVSYREANAVKRNDFLNLLLQIKNHGKIDDDVGESIGGLTMGQLAAQSFLFFLAGFETSSTTMTFCLYSLALNPDIQEKLREDIQSVLEKNDNVLTYEAMLEMKYLQMVIDDSSVNYFNLCLGLEDPNSEFFKHGRRVFDVTPFELLKFFFSSGYPELAKTLNLRQNPKEPTDFFKNTFLQTLEYREKNAFSRVDFVQLLLGLKDSFTPLELAAESFLVYVAGFETSSTLMTFTMYELALNLDIQEKLRDEIKTAIQNNDGKLTYDMLFDLEYLDQVIKESLRKYPPIPDSVRKCTNEYKIPGTNLIIPKGTTLELPIYSFHHDPEYFPDPKKFDPERFSPQNENNRHSFVYLPFGDGPRNCLGMRFGLMQSKLGIVKFLMSFEISPSDKTPIPMKFVPSAPFLAPVGGMWLNVRKLSD